MIFYLNIPTHKAFRIMPRLFCGFCLHNMFNKDIYYVLNEKSFLNY
jgi:hypothetical protein